MSKFPLCDRFNIGPEEIQRRMEYLRFGDQDRQNLHRIREVIAARSQVIADFFHDHLRRFSELEAFVSDPDKVASLKAILCRYLNSLGDDIDQPESIERRLQVGITHERIGLDLKWFICGHAILFERISHELADVLAEPGTSLDELRSLTSTLSKVQWLDAIFSMETYLGTSIERLEGVMERLTEAEAKLEEACRTDSVTGVLTRRRLLETLELESYRAGRWNHSLCILFLDIDRFKQINDRHGHATGDAALRKVAELLQQCMRSVDVIGRFGGEEFVIGLVECDLDMAARIGERARLLIAHTPIESPTGPIHLTVSIGLTARVAGERLETLLARADAAMYEAKRLGRNQQYVSHPEQARGTTP